MDKLKKLFNSKKVQIFFIVLIIFLGFLVRLFGLYKSGGLWYDEAVTYYTAQESFPFGILDKLKYHDYHAPLFYLILNIWMRFVGEHDFVIRLLPCLFGVLTIPVLYLAGKELKSYKVGVLAALLASINSVLIYYSQEIRFYSLLTFAGALCALFLIKVNKNASLKNYIGLIISNLLILYTSSIGFVFVFLEILILGIYFYLLKKDKLSLRNFILSQLVTFVLYIPYLPTLLYHSQSSSKSFLNQLGWIRFNLSSIFVILQNWFTPILTGIYNNPLNYFSSIHLNLISFLYIFMPIFIYLTGIILAIRKKDFSLVLFLTGISFLIIEIIGALTGNFGLITRYTLISLPFIIIVASYGLLSIKNKILSLLLCIFLIIINFECIAFYPFSASTLSRPEGMRYIANMLDNYDLDSRDKIMILPYGAGFIHKYYPYEKGQILRFDLIDIYHQLEKNELKKVLTGDMIKSLNRNNSKDLLRDYITSYQPAEPLIGYIKSEVINKLPKNRYFILITKKGYEKIDYEKLNDLIQHDYEYKHISFIEYLFLKTNCDVLEISKNNLNFIENKQEKGWEIFVFKK